MAPHFEHFQRAIQYWRGFQRLRLRQLSKKGLERFVYCFRPRCGAIVESPKLPFRAFAFYPIEITRIVKSLDAKGKEKLQAVLVDLNDYISFYHRKFYPKIEPQKT